MFDNFAPDAIRAVLDAVELAEEAGSGTVSTAHFLVAMLGQPTGRAAHVLAAARVDPAALEADLVTELAASRGRRRPSAGSVYSSEATMAISHAGSIARVRGDDLIDTHHLLLGCLQSRRHRARKILTRAGIRHTRIRAAEMQLGAPIGQAFPPAAIEWLWSLLDETDRFMAEAEAAQRDGRISDAVRGYEQAVAHVAAGPPDRAAARIDVYPHLIQALLLAGRVDEALDRMDEAEQALDDYEHFVWHSEAETETVALFRERYHAHLETGVTDLRFQLMIDRGQVALGRDDFTNALATGERLVALAEELGHDSALGAGRSIAGRALGYLGGADKQAASLLRASLAEPGIDPIDVAARKCNLAQLAFFTGRYDDAADQADQAGRLYADLGRERSAAVCDLVIAEATARSGGEIDRTVLQKAEVLDPDGRAELLGWAALIRAVDAAASDPVRALMHAETALGLAREHDHGFATGRALLLIGQLEANQGRLAEARAAYAEAAEFGDTLPARFAEDARAGIDALEDSP